MKIVYQRVTEARVEVDGAVVGQIGNGALILLGVGRGDTERDADYLLQKTIGLRVFLDDCGKMNCSIDDIGGSFLVVSQFTLYGDCRKGRRPSFDQAEEPDKARQLYEYFVARLREGGRKVETGRFAASMDVHLVNQGPVTLLYDSDSNHDKLRL